jgi:small GTP-binding protein
MAGKGMAGKGAGKGARAAKIVVTGPFGAGKTTLISAISEITVLSTERDVSDHTRAWKAETTVAMDFGRITIDSDLVLYLFGTPGQERFDFMWEILAEGMLGFVVMVDLSRPDSFDEAASMLAAFRGMARAPFVVAANKGDGQVGDDTLAQIRATLALEDAVPLVACDARDRASVKDVLLTLLYAAVATLDGGAEAASA